MKATLSLSLLLASAGARGAAQEYQSGKTPNLLQHELCRNSRAAQVYSELTGDQINEINSFFSKLEELKNNFELEVCELMSASPTAMEFLKKVIESDYLKISMLLEISGADSSDIDPEEKSTEKASVAKEAANQPEPTPIDAHQE